MNDLRVSTAQFETRDGDKTYNLSRIDDLCSLAVADGAQLVCFHELCVTGYTFLEQLSQEQVTSLAEPIGGESTRALQVIAARHGVLVSAGLIELDGGRCYNCHLVVSGDAVLASHRKIHEFVSPHLGLGDRYTVFDALGARIGILTCYDNNLPENARMTAMLGADMILAPHVTGCLPSPAPGRGIVEPHVWHERHQNPARCRAEFDGPKGRGWLMKWLPARAWENGVFVVYSNVLGVDGGTIKPGGSLILDPYGEVIAECRTLEDEVVTATLHAEARQLASGASYIRARRPALYSKMVEPNPHLAPDARPEVYWQRIRPRQPWEKD
jgi:predicted amidohydrolase